MNLVDKIYRKKIFGTSLCWIEPLILVIFGIITLIFSNYREKLIFSLRGCRNFAGGGYTCENFFGTITLPAHIQLIGYFLFFIGTILTIWLLFKSFLALIYGKAYFSPFFLLSPNVRIISGWFVRILGLVGIFSFSSLIYVVIKVLLF